MLPEDMSLMINDDPWNLAADVSTFNPRNQSHCCRVIGLLKNELIQRPHTAIAKSLHSVLPNVLNALLGSDTQQGLIHQDLPQNHKELVYSILCPAGPLVTTLSKISSQIDLSCLVPTCSLPVSVQRAIKNYDLTTISRAFCKRIKTAAAPYKSLDQPLTENSTPPGEIKFNNAMEQSIKVVHIYLDMLELFVIYLLRSPVLPWMTTEEMTSRSFGDSCTLRNTKIASGSSVSENSWSVLKPVVSLSGTRPSNGTTHFQYTDMFRPHQERKIRPGCYIHPIYFKCIDEYLDIFLQYKTDSKNNTINSEMHLSDQHITSQTNITRDNIGSANLMQQAPNAPPENIVQKILRFMDMGPVRPIDKKESYNTRSSASLSIPNSNFSSRLDTSPPCPPSASFGHMWNNANFFFLSALVEYWLPDDASASCGRLPAGYDPSLKLTETHINCVKAVVDYIQRLDFDFLSHLPRSESANLSEIVPPFDKSTFYAVFQRRLFSFFSSAICLWSSEKTLIPVAQLWKVYVGPWMKSPDYKKGYTAKWAYFVKENFMFYTVLIVPFLRRLRSFGLFSSTPLEHQDDISTVLNILQLLLSVYDDDHLLRALESVELSALSVKRISMLSGDKDLNLQKGASGLNTKLFEKYNAEDDYLKTQDILTNRGIELRKKLSLYLNGGCYSPLLIGDLLVGATSHFGEDVESELFMKNFYRELASFHLKINNIMKIKPRNSISYCKDASRCFRIWLFLLPGRIGLRSLQLDAQPYLSKAVILLKHFATISFIFLSSLAYYVAKVVESAVVDVYHTIYREIFSNIKEDSAIIASKLSTLDNCLRIVKKLQKHSYRYQNATQSFVSNAKSKNGSPSCDTYGSLGKIVAPPLSRNAHYSKFQPYHNHKKHLVSLPRSSHNLSSIKHHTPRLGSPGWHSRSYKMRFLVPALIKISAYFDLVYYKLSSTDKNLPPIPSYVWLIQFSFYKNILAAAVLFALLYLLTSFVLGTLNSLI